MKKNILWGELSWLLGPKIILPFLLTVALLTVALKIGDVGQVIPRMRTMPLWIICFALVMAATYLFLKGLQLHLLLGNLGAHPNTKHFLLAYSIGELAVTLPLGVFLQNWVLSTTGSVHFGRSSAATIMMLLLETAAVLLYLAVAGIPRWPEVRPVAVLVLTGMALVVFILTQTYDALWMTIPAIIIIGREITISALREWMAQMGQCSKVSVAFIGKLKTATQMLALVLLLYHQPVFGWSPVMLGIVLLDIAAALTLVSMLKYLITVSRG